ncbi:hypothetical protein, partial [Vibrio thalassae]|uniref:hypothetical protein n=1 Tax=Vibrio thalassae TaxID=1243014 RepID=UPI00363EFCA2
MTDVSVDTTSALSSAVGNGSLSLFGEFTNIQQYAAIPFNPLAQNPTEAHYQALGFETALDDGYFPERRNYLNSALLNQQPTLTVLSDLQDFINQDSDGDGLRNYFDPQSQNEYNFYASYTLHPEIVNNLPVDTNQEYSYLIKTDIRLNSNATTQSLYLAVPTWTYGSSRHLANRWPHNISLVIKDYFSSEGVAFIRQNTTSGYLNELSGIDWMKLNYIEQWWTFVDYVRDATNTTPSSTDYAAIGFSSLTQEQIDELNGVITQNQATPNDFDKMNEMVTSYLL